MTASRPPYPTDSVAWLNPTLDDLQRAYELIVRCDVIGYGELDHDLEDLQSDWGQIDLKQDAWLVIARSGELVGYRAVVPRAPERRVFQKRRREATMRLILGIRIPLRWTGLPVLFLTLLGILGLGFVVAGTVLIFKQVESFANLIQNGLAFFNGSFLPIEAMPGWMASFARVLPSTQGIVVLRRVVLQGQSLAAVWQDGSLSWLMVHSAIWFAAGCLAFGAAERVAKEQGSLGQY